MVISISSGHCVHKRVYMVISISSGQGVCILHSCMVIYIRSGHQVCT